jgi:hypothetical protein
MTDMLFKWLPMNSSCVVCVPISNRYVDNGNNSYTFTLVPDKDVDRCPALAFTFAQGVLMEISGPDWTYNGNHDKLTMDLVECQTYTWTVALSCKDLNNHKTMFGLISK